MMTNKEQKAKAFSSIEWLMAWRYLRSRKSEGGVSAISLISLIGVALGVFAMVATFSVREGFRGEYVRTILGSEGHASIYSTVAIDTGERTVIGISDYPNLIDALGGIDGVATTTALVNGQALVSMGDNQTVVDVLGIEPDEFRDITTITTNSESFGELDSFGDGDTVALGRGVASRLGASIGDRVVFTTMGQVQTAFGAAPRSYGFDVAYIYSSGNDYLDSARAYIPFDIAQSYFSMEGFASQIDITVKDPNMIDGYRSKITSLLGDIAYMRSWQEKNARALSGLKTEDNLMFILTSILVLVATFTIVAGQIMLVKNKTSDIAILRTMGYSRAAVTRMFFLTGIILGAVGTILGVILGVLFSLYFTPIFHFVNLLIGGGADNTWALSVVPNLEAKLTWEIILRAVLLAMGLSVIITYLPARSAAKLDPSEALRHG